MPPDPLPRLPLPDPLLARKALGEMRGALRAGYGMVRETIEGVPLPPPVAAVAGTVMRRVDDLAHKADAVASTLVHGVLAATGAGREERSGDEEALLTLALRRAVALLGPDALWISDSAVRQALDGLGTGPLDDARAAALTRRLIEAGAVRSAEAPAGAAPAIFAAVLAALEDGGPDGIEASAALADALTEDLDAAGSDEAALARLFAEFRGHV